MKKFLAALFILMVSVANAQNPEAPSNLIAIPSNNGGKIYFEKPVYEYNTRNYQYSFDNGNTWVTPSPAITSSPITITGLTNCTSYSVIIRAVSTPYGPLAATDPVTLIPKATSGDIGAPILKYNSNENKSWSGVAFGNGVYVAVSDDNLNGGIMRSANGVNWTTVTPPISSQWAGIAYGNGKFLAVKKSPNDTNCLMSSTDGISWTLQSTPVFNNWQNISFVNGKFFLLGDDNTNVLSSANGVDWTIGTATVSTPSSVYPISWTGITYGNGVYVAVAMSFPLGSKIMVSSNGTDWVEGQTPSGGGIFLNGVAFGNGRFVGIGYYNGGVITSTNGINWEFTYASTSVTNNSYWNSISYGNGLFVAVGSSGNNKLMISKDGIQWLNKPELLSDNADWSSVTYGNGKFVAVANAGTSRILNYAGGFNASPDAPSIVNGGANSTQATVLFTSPAESNPPIQYYEYSINDGTTWINPSPTATASPMIIPGLSGGSIRIHAVNAVGGGCPSAAFTLAQAPPAPVVNAAYGLNNGGQISFTQASNGGSEITNYEYSIDNGSNWTAFSPASNVSPLIISGGLNNCTNYQVKIRAVNIAGPGNASNAVSLQPTQSQLNAGSTWTSIPININYNAWRSVTYGNGVFVAVAQSGSQNIMYSTDGMNWSVISSPTTIDWGAVTFGNGLFVAVANQTYVGNEVMTSSDGIHWTMQNADFNIGWSSICYGNGKFVAVAYNNVMTSPDGINWSLQTTNDYYTYSSITYGNGIFVAVGGDNNTNILKTSTDGVNWTSNTTTSYAMWKSVCFGNGRFVAVSASGGYYSITTSTDGITWTEQPSPSSSNWNTVTYGNGMFVALANLNSGGSDYVMTSPDGLNWTSHSLPENRWWYGVTYGNGKFVGVTDAVIVSNFYTAATPAPSITSTSTYFGAAILQFNTDSTSISGSVTNYEYSLDNGVTWLARNPASVTSPLRINGLTNGTTYNIKIRSVNSGGTSCPSNMVSVTPTVGTVATAPVAISASNLNMSSMVVFTPSTNNGGSDITNYQYSIDNGNTWITPSPALTSSPFTITGLSNCTTYQIKIRAVNSAGFSAASNMVTATPKLNFTTNPDTWIERNTPTLGLNTQYQFGGWNSLAYGNGKFVAVAFGNSSMNKIMTSSDGNNWTSRATPIDRGWSVAYGNGLFVAVSPDGTGNDIITSPDGINWTVRSHPIIGISDVYFCNGLFIGLCGANNSFITSPDGINWTIRNLPALDLPPNVYIYNLFFNSVTYGNGRYVAVASYEIQSTYNFNLIGLVMTSTDGVIWTQVNANFNNYPLRDIVYAQNKFVATTFKGMLTSADGLSWTYNPINTRPYNLYKHIAYGNGFFVASSDVSDSVYFSRNGTNWQRSLLPNRSYSNWAKVCYGNDKFLMLDFERQGQDKAIVNCSAGILEAPDMPVINSANLGNNQNVTVAFTPPSNSGSSAIINYEYSVDDGNNWITPSPAVTSSPLTFTGVTNGIIRIRAVNSGGPSCPSASVVLCSTIYSTETISACGSYTWHGTTYTSSNNTATWTGVSSLGCDSVVRLNLTINTLSTTNVIETRCNNQLPFNWHGQNYYTSGNYTWTGANTAGCDSVVTLNLTVNNSSNSNTNVSICNNQLPYVWNSHNYTASGTYTWTGTNASGCDSTATLNLTVRNTSSYTQTVTSCGSYTWHGTTYNSSNNTATWTGTNAAGCDSVVTLNLTIIPASLPVTGAVNGISNVCPYIGTNTELTYTAFNIPGATYTWTIPPSNVILVSGQGTNTIKLKFTNGFANVNNKQLKVKATTATCGTTNQVTFYLLAQAPVTPANITASSSSVCASLGTNVPITYTIPKAYAAVSYIWSAQNGTTNITSINGAGANDTSVAVTFTSAFTSSNITVQSVNDCGVSGIRSYTITKDAPPQPGLISGPTNACEYIGETGQSSTYTVPAVANVDSYNWSLPNGVFAVTGQGTRTISFKYPSNFTSGTVSVTVTNGCGTGSARSLSVSRLQAGTPSMIDVINTGTCPNRTYSYTLSAMPSNATSVQWTAPTGGTIVSGQGTTSITVSYTGAIISGEVKAQSVNNCSVGAFRTASVKLPACTNTLAPGVYTKGNRTLPAETVDVSVYPNPSVNDFNMIVKAAGTSKVKVMDIQGRLIQSLIAVPYETTHFGNELKAGVYFLEVRSGGEVRMVRVVKY